MLDIITSNPYGYCHFSKVFHQYNTITRSRSSCFITNSIPSSPLLINNPKFPNNTVGIIGGVSTACTLHFLHRFSELSSQKEGQTIPFILCNDTITIPGINKFDESRSDRRVIIVERLRERRVLLEKLGAGCIVMPCHRLQLLDEEIGTDSSVPFICISDCVVKELKRANLKPVEASGSNVRIGIISSDSSLSTRLYQERLQNEGFEVIYPDRATTDHVVLPAAGAFKRKDTEGARTLLTIAIRTLLVKAANVVVLASHELVQILPRDDPIVERCVDPIECLVKEAVRWVKSVDG